MTTCWKICINLKEKHAIKWLIDFKYDSTRITQVLKTMRQIILSYPEALCVIQCNLMLIFSLLICWLILKREPIPHKKADFTDQFSYPLVPRICVLKKHHFDLQTSSNFWALVLPPVSSSGSCLQHWSPTKSSSEGGHSIPCMGRAGASRERPSSCHIWGMKLVPWLGYCLLHCLNHLLEGLPETGRFVLFSLLFAWYKTPSPED